MATEILETSAPIANTPSTAAPAPQPVEPPAPVYTQAQVDAMMRQAHDSGAAAVRRANEGRQKSADPAPITKQEPAPQAASMEHVATIVAQAVARETAFGDAVREHGLTSAQASMLRALRDTASLTDATAVSSWVKEQAAVFGKTVNNAASVPVHSTPVVPAPISPSAPSTAIPFERDVSVLEMSPDQIHDLMRKKGGDPSRPYHPSNRAARREIRKETESALRTRRVRLGSG